MSIFRKYTRKSLAANRSRTLVTIIGIVLSMALMTAVTEGAYSGVKFMESAEIARSGIWEVYFSDMNDEKLEKLKNDPEAKAKRNAARQKWRQNNPDKVMAQRERDKARRAQKRKEEQREL